jgi:hypothetical protein
MSPLSTKLIVQSESVALGQANGSAPYQSFTDQPARRQVALALLFQAYEIAQRLQQPASTFAVSGFNLRAAGLTENDLCWLLTEGLIKHTVERIQSHGTTRVFDRTENLGLHERNCFVLTPAGYEVVRQACIEQAFAGSSSAAERSAKTAAPLNPAQPYWDETSHTLFWADEIVHHFKKDAPNQETILRTFQVHHWQPWIPVSLLPNRNDFQKGSLHNTIKNLNRNVCLHLQFRQEGNGDRIGWESLR